MYNDNNQIEVEIIKGKKEYYVKELEKCDDVEGEIKEMIKETCCLFTSGVIMLGAMVSTSTIAFTADDLNPFFSVASFLSSIVGGIFTYKGLKSLIATMTTMSAYISAKSDIKEKLNLLEIELNIRENRNNENNKRGRMI